MGAGVIADVDITSPSMPLESTTLSMESVEMREERGESVERREERGDSVERREEEEGGDMDTKDRASTKSNIIHFAE